MQNLAGVPTPEANEVVRRELERARIPIVDAPIVGEVRASLGGILQAGPYTIRLKRFWVYWVAHVEESPYRQYSSDGPPALPHDLARALNDAPYAGDRTYYSGGTLNLGAVARADGYAGGQKSADLRDGVRGWHIDTQGGLDAFAAWIRINLGEEAAP